MTHEDTIPQVTQEVIAVVQGAVQAASEDYFVWSRGHILYECAEFLPQVYAAKRLFNIFKKEVTVRVERPVDELVLPRMGGRVDLTVEFSTGALYAIEFKRYPDDRNTKSDRDRLRKIVSFKGGRVGLLAAPWYTKGESDDWPRREKDRHADDPSQIWHLSDPKPLADCFRQVDGFTYGRVLVVEVCASGASNREADTRG
jgi:hypothetical protein